jgi:DNA-binding cell septation regulator SpoVG
MSYTHQNLQAYLEVQVEFELIPPTLYTVIFSVQGQNGMLTAVSGNDFVVSGNQLTEGSSVMFTATPNTGYQVRQWTLNNLVVNTPGNEIFTEPIFVLTNLEQDVVVTVEFEPIPPTLYTVIFSVQGQNGTLTAVSDNDYVVSGNQLTEGSSVMFTATPNTGYQVRQWTLNNLVVNTPDNEIFTEPIFVLANLEHDVVVTVEFEQIPISQAVVSFAVELGSGTLVAEFDNNQIESGVGVPHFSEVLFSAIPDSGWKVKRWLVNDYEVLNTDSSIYVLDTLVVELQQQNIFVVVEFETLVSVFEMQNKTVFYPNPCNSKLYITNHNDIESLTLYNLKGESVLQVSRPAQGFIYVESMHSGAYILKIEYKENSHESIKIWKY